MAWTQITCDVPDALKDAVIGALSESGAAGVWESETAGLVAYFAGFVDSESIRRSIAQVFERAGIASPEIRQDSVADEDWSQEWRKSWSSFPIGRRFYVIPSWSEAVCPADRLPIRIDPGQAFGTGTHESTQLALEAMERCIAPAHTVVDVGAGSGILAIASQMLGAARVVACDNDPVAVEVALENLPANGIRDVMAFCGSVDALASGIADLVLCNLTADVIADLFPEILRVTRTDGLAIFSGVLKAQFVEIANLIHRHRHSIVESGERGEWIALVVRKHGG